jgi:NADP-dependent 3-hydroxy acid dehydrogenase YdfG
MSDLPASDRPVVVTGASSGIGEAAARRFAELGHHVVLGARRVERLESTVAELRAAGARADAAALDLRDRAAIAAFADECTALTGGVEILVSCAGDVLPQRAHETDPDDFATQVEVNLLGAQRLIHALTPPMVDRRRGDVVIVSSDVVRAPRPMMSSYVAAKWGLEGLARAMQMELEGTGVRASIVRPGPTLTGMGMDWDPDALGVVLDEWKRWGLVRHSGYLAPEGVANAVVAVATQPAGTHLTLVEVVPEAPVRRPRTDDGAGE